MNAASFPCLLAGALLAALPATAVVVQITPAADAHLNAAFPDRNFGAETSFIVGGLVTGSANRALLFFDIAASVPADATINSVTLELTNVSRAPGPASDFELHRQLKSWTEGAGAGIQPAADGEVTWDSRAHNVELWDAPGGLAGTDFAAAISGDLNTGGDTLVFSSTSGLVADVQAWLDAPAGNFGWMLLSDDETSARTARRIASRESADAPLLTIDYTPVPEPAALTAATAAAALGFGLARRRGRCRQAAGGTP
jgi:hypothetical protein